MAVFDSAIWYEALFVSILVFKNYTTQIAFQYCSSPENRKQWSSTFRPGATYNLPKIFLLVPSNLSMTFTRKSQISRFFQVHCTYSKLSEEPCWWTADNNCAFKAACAKWRVLCNHNVRNCSAKGIKRNEVQSLCIWLPPYWLKFKINTKFDRSKQVGR